MTEKKETTGEWLTVDFPIILPVTTTVGATGSKFLIELRDNKRIMAIKCPTCRKVYIPPRSSCPSCFSKMEDWVELSGKGTVLTYTVVNYSESYHPVDTPIIYAVIQLDGADTALPHLLNEVDIEDLRIGMRVEPVFASKRSASIMDIKYFRPI